MRSRTVEVDWNRTRWCVLLFAIVACTSCANTRTNESTGDRIDTPTVHAIVVPAPSEAALITQRVGRKDQPLVFGFGRTIDAKDGRVELHDLKWTKDGAGNLTATISVQSIGARSLRVGMRLNQSVAGLQIYFRGSAQPIDPVRLLSPGSGNFYWSPVVDGDTLWIDLQSPAKPPEETVLEFPILSHIL